MENNFFGSEYFNKIAQIFEIRRKERRRKNSLQSTTSDEDEINFLEKNLVNFAKIINSIQEFKSLKEESLAQIEAISSQLDKESKKDKFLNKNKILILIAPLNETQSLFINLILHDINAIQVVLASKQFLKLNESELLLLKESLDKVRLSCHSLKNDLSSLPQKLLYLENNRTEQNLLYHKAKKTKALFDDYFSTLKDILIFYVDKKIPFLDDNEIVTALCFKFSVFIVYILKYGSFYREWLVKSLGGDILEIKDSFDVREYPIFNLMFSEKHYEDFVCEGGFLFGYEYFYILQVVHILLELNILPILLIDTNDFYCKHFMMRTLRNKIIIVEFSFDEQSANEIIECVEKGHILILKNFDFELFEAISPIIDYFHKNNIIEGIENHFENKLEKETSIIIFGRSICVHKDFRILLILQDPHFLRSDYFNFTFLIYADIEDRYLWEKSLFALLYEKFDSKLMRNIKKK